MVNPLRPSVSTMLGPASSKNSQSSSAVYVPPLSPIATQSSATSSISSSPASSSRLSSDRSEKEAVFPANREEETVIELDHSDPLKALDHFCTIWNEERQEPATLKVVIKKADGLGKDEIVFKR